MGAGTIQIQALGPQDFHLTANPQITFFKSVYKRHTNFSKEIKRIYFSGGKSPDFGSKDVIAEVQNEGDLLGNVFLEVTIVGTSASSIKRSVANFSHSLIDKIECKIGGYTIDTHYGRFYQILDEIEGKINEDNQQHTDDKGGKHVSISRTSDENQSREQVNAYSKLIGNHTLCFGGNQASIDNIDVGTYTKKFYYPLRFWFNKNPGHYLPLVALYKHKLELFFNFAEKNAVIGDINSISMSTKIYGEFYNLDSDEKTRFAQSNHEYIIEQLQLNNNFKSITTTSTEQDGTYGTYETAQVDYDLNFSHPIKYMTWVIVNEGTQTSNPGEGPCYFISLTNSSLYGSDGNGGSVELFLEGVVREIELPMIYYTRAIPGKLLKAVPILDRIGFYSFALNPLEAEPSGTCNFSKLYNKNIKFKFGNRVQSVLQGKDLYIYAVNYNVLTITGGMAAIRYS